MHPFSDFARAILLSAFTSYAACAFADDAVLPVVSHLKANVEFSDNSYPILCEQNLQNGKNVYSTEISGHNIYRDVGEFAGLQYLRTDNRWWNLETARRFIEFDIDRPATVYVAFFKKLRKFDDALQPQHWLRDPSGGWKYLDKEIRVEARDEHTFGVFAKTFKPGRVTLPGNAIPGTNVGVYSHYLVFIGPAIGEPQENKIPDPVLRGKIPAFPGAEGGGMYATGGRGGSVYAVTNLEDYGTREKPIPGSLRDAVSQPNRTIVFRISGTIALKSELKIVAPNITLAGQTAPGDGICVKDYPLSIAGDNKIIRFIRSRPGDASNREFDSFGAAFGNQIICDHISAAWSTDEAASFRYLRDFTLQWSIIGESNLHAQHQSGAHGFGGIWGGKNATYHHNLVLHHVSRMPRFNQGPIDFRNNVFYNWGYKAEYGDYNLANFVGNYYRPGSGTLPTARAKFAEPLELQPWRGFGLFLNGNVMHENLALTENNTLGVVGMDDAKRYILLTQEVPTPQPVRTQSAPAAFNTVLTLAGASPVPEQRDAIDARFVEEARSGTGNMIYTRPATLEFAKNEEQRKRIEETLKNHKAKQVRFEYPVLKSSPAPADADNDGMPDVWEQKHQLNPNDSADRNGDNDADGYTNLEEYLNELAAPAMPVAADYAQPVSLKPVDLSSLKGVSAQALQNPEPLITVVQGNRLLGPQQPVLRADRVWLPAQAVMEALGFTLQQEMESKTLKARLDAEEITLECETVEGMLAIPAEHLAQVAGVRWALDTVNHVLMIAR